jgi:hypothetical protein
MAHIHCTGTATRLEGCKCLREEIKDAELAVRAECAMLTIRANSAAEVIKDALIIISFYEVSPQMLVSFESPEGRS